jgi:hypothetical protein
MIEAFLTPERLFTLIKQPHDEFTPYHLLLYYLLLLLVGNGEALYGLMFYNNSQHTLERAFPNWERLLFL